MEKITFFVPGRPRPQGSMKFISKGGRSFPVTNKKLEAWRADVKLFAEDVMAGRMVYDGCGLSLAFTFCRPKNQYRTGKFSHLLRDDSPDRMLKMPDIDKLVRGILDALTGVVFADDCEVDRVGAVKQWGAREGIDITVRGVFYAARES